MWKSVIRNPPDQQDGQGNTNPLYEEWFEEVLREPWFVALRDLVRWTGTWTGTEEQLMEEIRLRVDREVWESENFPSDFQRLDEYHEIIFFSYRNIHLDLRDYRELRKKDIKDFNVPGWGPEAPILLEQGFAAARLSYEDAMLELAKYENPLLLAIVIFTDSPKFARNQRQWTGSTLELVEVLKSYYPRPTDNCPYYLDHLKWASDRGVYAFDGHSCRELIEELRGSSDYVRFHKRMKTFAHILKDVDIKVSWKKVPWTVTDPEGETRSTKRTYWTIKAPRWRS